jgi:hypothetical protein
MPWTEPALVAFFVRQYMVMGLVLEGHLPQAAEPMT